MSCSLAIRCLRIACPSWNYTKQTYFVLLWVISYDRIWGSWAFLAGLGCNDVIGENFQKNIFFGVFALPIKFFCQNYFYSDSGFICFNLMYHVTISIIWAWIWSFWPFKCENMVTSGRIIRFSWQIYFWNPWSEPFQMRYITQ